MMKTEELYREIHSMLETKGLRMAAALYRNNRIYSIGVASTIPHVVFSNKKILLPSTHAEVDAYRKAINNYVRTRRKKLTANLIVVRVAKDNYYPNSKPCKHCLEFMRSNIDAINIRKVTYCDGLTMKTKKFGDMHTKHISGGWKWYLQRN